MFEQADTYDEVYDLYPEDKMGFAKPATPTHALDLLNKYMRTDLIYHIHVSIHRMRDADEPGSPIHHLAKSLVDVVSATDGTDLFDIVSRNPLHIKRHYDFQPEPDYHHDIKLMKHHLKHLTKTIEELQEYYF